MKIPPGLELSGTPSSPRGRSLKATRSFAPGELVARFDVPSVAIPDSPSLSTTCSYCLRSEAPVRACTGCRGTFYCSTPCQKADWTLVHKPECKVFQRVRARGGHDALPTPVRVLVQMLLLPDMREAAAEMEGHVEAFRGKRAEWADMQLQANGALHYLEHEATPKRVSEAVELLCKLATNSFNRQDKDVSQTGAFINPALAMVNHSCIPNTSVQFAGRHAILHANRAIKKDEEVEISYIDRNLHRAHRQKALKDRWHFECACARCRDDLDVYQVALRYPHIELNSLSLNPGLATGRRPAGTSPVTQPEIEKIHLLCTQPQDLSDRRANFRERWQLCEPLREAGLFAIEPIPQIISEASIYFAACQDLPSGLALSCFLTIYCDPFQDPMPFSAARLKGLLMLANVLSNTILPSGSAPTSQGGGALNGKVARALARMDQVTIYQAILAIIVRWAPSAHSKDWLVHRQASDQLKDVEGLPGREDANSLVKIWAADKGIPEAVEFFELRVLKPLRELAGLALEIMGSEFGIVQGLLRSE